MMTAVMLKLHPSLCRDEMVIGVSGQEGSATTSPRAEMAILVSSFWRDNCLAILLVIRDRVEPLSSSVLTSMDFPVGPVTSTWQVMSNMPWSWESAAEVAWLVVPVVV